MIKNCPWKVGLPTSTKERENERSNPNDARDDTTAHTRHEDPVGFELREIPHPWLIGCIARDVVHASRADVLPAERPGWTRKRRPRLRSRSSAPRSTPRSQAIWSTTKITDLQRQYADLQNRTASTEIRLQGLKK